MTTEELRRDFEAWFGPLHKAAMLYRHSDTGTYSYLFTRGAWEAWQEARRRYGEAAAKTGDAT